MQSPNSTGCRNLPRSEPAEPTLSVRAVSDRCSNLARKLSPILEESRDQVACYYQIPDPDAFIFLGGPASEVIERNLGSKHRVVRLCALTRDIFAWAGYREQWQRLERERSFRFVSAGFTFHAGRQGELHKPQMIRSEWVSKRSPAFDSMIGHPHWQVDVLDTIRRQSMWEAAYFGDDTESNFTASFRENGPTDQVVQSFLNLPIERMHLASAAAWWRRPQVDIAHSPKSITELDRWVVGCIAYIRKEFARL